MKNITKKFGDFTANNKINLTVHKGEVHALLGENGCTVNGLENFERISFWRTPVSKCASQEVCVPYYRWVTDYIAVLGGR